MKSFRGGFSDSIYWINYKLLWRETVDLTFAVVVPL